MIITKEKAIRLLDEEYDKWRDIEEHNERLGAGRTGPDGSLVEYSFHQLFNEIMIRFEYGLVD